MYLHLNIPAAKYLKIQMFAHKNGRTEWYSVQNIILKLMMVLCLFATQLL